jgi:SET domain-containing protein
MKFVWIPYGNKKHTFLDGKEWVKPLRIERCIGKECKRLTVIGLRWCAKHMAQDLKLKIKTATNPSHGKGVFAVGNSGNVVFKKGHVITYYDGEFITTEEMNSRYKGDLYSHTAPYALEVFDQVVDGKIISHITGCEDGALHRGIGTMINHSRRFNAKYQLREMPPHISKGLDENVPKNRQNCVAVIAVKPIRGGEEIFVDYSEDYEFNDVAVYKTV